MSHTLAIDTATVVCVGLADDDRVLGSLRHDDPRAHAERTTPLIQELLARCALTPRDLSRVVVGVGPGPYTGLRVGIATAHSLAAALGIEVVGVCSLDAVALAAPADLTEFTVVTDARRRELYSADYRRIGGGHLERISGPRVGPLADLEGRLLLGPGVPAAILLGADPAQLGGAVPLDAGLLAGAVEDLAAVGLEPLYLRNPDAQVSTRRKSTLRPGVVLTPRPVPGSSS